MKINCKGAALIAALILLILVTSYISAHTAILNDMENYLNLLEKRQNARLSSR